MTIPISTDSNIKATARMFAADAATMTRPNDTTTYANNDALANITTAGSVVPLEFTAADLNDATLNIRGGRVVASDSGAAGTTFKLHLFRSKPTAVAGDNAAFALPAIANGYMGSLSGAAVACSDGAIALLKPDSSWDMIGRPTSGGKTLYGLLQVSSYTTPVAQATFAVTLFGLQGRA